MQSKARLRYLKERASKFFYWKNWLLADCMGSLFEALVVLAIAYIYLVVLSIDFALSNQGVDLFEAIKKTVKSTLRPTEVIIYVAAILSSTTAYFVARLRTLRKFIKRIALILLATAVLFWFAIPLFIFGLQGAPANEAFAEWLAVLLGVGAICIWLYSLFTQRRMFEREVDISGDRRGREIARIVGGT